jgi:hypothetical protein
MTLHKQCLTNSYIISFIKEILFIALKNSDKHDLKNVVMEPYWQQEENATVKRKREVGLAKLKFKVETSTTRMAWMELSPLIQITMRGDYIHKT